MNIKAGRLLDQLKSYNMIQEDIEKLEERLSSAGYSLTAHYGLTGGGHGGLPSSKVENLAVRLLELETQLKRKREIIAQIDHAISVADLNKRERELIACTIQGDTLSSYARRKNIYKSHVYKIRDRALRKMVKCMENDETGFRIG